MVLTLGAAVFVGVAARGLLLFLVPAAVCFAVAVVVVLRPWGNEQ